MLANINTTGSHESSFHNRYQSGEFEPMVKVRPCVQHYIPGLIRDIYGPQALLSGPSDTEYARFVRELADQILLFLFEDYIPFLWGDVERSVDVVATDLLGIDFVFWNTHSWLSLFCTNLPEGYDETAPGLIWKRHKAGLLRQSQLRILRLVFTTFLDQVRDLIGTMDRRDDNDRLILMRAFYSFRILLEKLLCSPEFRSERLELLLLKYLEEPQVDFEVARGVMQCEVLLSVAEAEQEEDELRMREVRRRREYVLLSRI
ncbi:hypothetical protein BJ508DRAFT_366108 [Ascobolus immersus RN42]|uniref:Uncharacterized protein n=1 Tax=Ascobolus immersus RN42 TaxID=1160509 RepID=A0A3N4HQ57_ASCIM|nr:hypothetical protein BJ508DRAFT_366108 [Ascobolus immersus RN42]